MPTQQAVIHELAADDPEALVQLASDIVDHGIDPTSLPAVVATDDRRRRYRVLEGNRRVLALKVLETPNIVSSSVSDRQLAKLSALSKKYADEPLAEVQCVLFDRAEEANHWIKLRHTGANDGRGLKEWGPNEKERWDVRHGGGNKKRSAGGQVLDFAQQQRSIAGAQLSNVDRLAKSPTVRKKFGLDSNTGVLVSHFPASEMMKPWNKVIDDLASGRIKVKHIYDADARDEYLAEFSTSDLPDPKKKLAAPVALADLAGTDAGARGATGPRPKAKKKTPASRQRTSLIPRGCPISPTEPRVNDIYNEMLNLDADSYPNSCAVMLRVFLELSVDHTLQTNSWMTDTQLKSASLHDKLIKVSEKMHAAGTITDDIRQAVRKVADSQHTLAANLKTFNQFVHNKIVRPKPAELRLAWDELQPFLERVWP
jgi:hypothetical protein